MRRRPRTASTYTPSMAARTTRTGSAAARLPKSWAVTLGGWYKNYKIDDANAAPLNYLPGGLFLNANDGNYKGTVGYARLNYRWQVPPEASDGKSRCKTMSSAPPSPSAWRRSSFVIAPAQLSDPGPPRCAQPSSPSRARARIGSRGRAGRGVIAGSGEVAGPFGFSRA